MIEAARPATAADLPTLVALSARSVAEQTTDRGGAMWSVREARPQPADASLAALLDDPASVVLAGVIDDVVLGFAVVTTETLRDGSLLGRITDLYVEPEAREVGVGEMLADACLAWCRERGCRGVDSLVLPGNRAAKNFFERLGLTARAIVVHKAL